MDSENEIQKFNERASIYCVVFNFIVRTQMEFEGKKITELSKKGMKRFIEVKGILLNSWEMHSPTWKISDGDKIEILSAKISFVCKKDENYNDLEEPVTYNIDYDIKDFLIHNLGTYNLGEVKADKIKLAFATLINLFQDKGFELIKSSTLSYELTDFIKTKVTDSDIVKELHIPKAQLNFGGKLIELLIQGKGKSENELRLINDNLLSGHYDTSLFRYLQDYRKLISTDSFQFLIFPLLNNNVASPIAIENLLRLIGKAV